MVIALLIVYYIIDTDFREKVNGIFDSKLINNLKHNKITCIEDINEGIEKTKISYNGLIKVELIESKIFDNRSSALSYIDSWETWNRKETKNYLTNYFIDKDKVEIALIRISETGSVLQYIICTKEGEALSPNGNALYKGK